MTDQPLRQILSAWLSEQTLPHEVEAHLAESAGAAEERLELRLTVLALRQLPAPALPRSFTLDEVTVSRYRRRQRAGTLTWVLRAIVASAAVLLLLVGAGDLRQSLEPPAMVTPVAATVQTQALSAEVARETAPRLGAPAQPHLPTAVYRGLEVALASIAAAAGGALWWTSRRARG
jgi:anti-sigma factor RsiW